MFYILDEIQKNNKNTCFGTQRYIRTLRKIWIHNFSFKI